MSVEQLDAFVDDEDVCQQFVNGTGGLDAESDRQMILRALAIQSLCYPGFEHANREIAKKLQGEELFDEFKGFLGHVFDAFELWGVDIGMELHHE